MHLLRPSHLVAAAATVVGISTATFSTSGARPASASHADGVADARRIARIRTHFDSVLTELAASAADSLSRPARARRSALIETLRAYRDRGDFPHNYDFAGQAIPYFVDRRTGALCAVAHLLASTGRRDIVDRVAISDNNVWVAQLAGDTAFTRWLVHQGLTLAEAARIQVPYMQPETPAQKARNSAFLVVAPVAVGSALVTTALNALGNADGHQRATRVVGIAAGAASLALGAMLVTRSDVPTSVGAATAGVGGLSLMLAGRATHRHRSLVARQRELDRARHVEAAVAPMIGAQDGGRAGMMLSVRY
ncbi:MAG TPA: hypothetical protein VJT85_07775 [Gemmatimonadaceae bacterium]|nr:hypothetical protein [Gemmatimonadaceae bacterium]